MKLNASPELREAAEKVLQAIDRDATARRVLAGEELTVGLSSDPAYQTPAHALDQAVYVGDAAHIAPDMVATEEVKALFTKNPSKVLEFVRWNKGIRKYEKVYRKVGDVSDAAPDLIGAQLLAAPGLVNYFGNIFKKPLLYSKARDLVSIQAGSNPWAEVMSLYTADYAGFAVLEATGTPENNNVQDVNAQAGMLTAPILNMSTSYSLSVEELERARNGGMPFGQELINQKRSYADYALEMLTDYLVYYGNVATETDGLFDVNPIFPWPTASMYDIATDPAETTKGSKIYQALAALIVTFLTQTYNKFNRVRIATSPLLYNILTSSPYSDVYNPNAALKIMVENFMAGETKSGKIPDIEIFPDPLLAPNTLFNPNDFDYLVITAPEIEAGPDETMQPLVLAGAPLMRFVYPTIPGQYNTSYKFLRRWAGIFAPVPQAVQVVSGFGFNVT